MGINTKRWAQKKSDVDRKLKERQEGKLWGKIEEGEYLCYVHPILYPNDTHEHTGGFNFIEVAMHYGLGGQKNAQMCLDYKANPILSHPLLQSFVANREKNAFKITPKLRCEVCEKMETGEITDRKNKQQLKWLLGMTPVWYRKSKSDPWTRLKFNPKFLIAGPQIFNGYMNSFIDLANDEIDPTVMEAAVFMKLTRTGTDFNTTEYSVTTDIGSARKPVKLDKAQRAILAKVVKPKGDLDLFAIAASFTKSPRQISDLIAGVSERNADDEQAETPRECFGKNWADDDECKACDSNEECMRVCGVGSKKVEANKGKQPGKSSTRSPTTTKNRDPEPDEHPPDEQPPEEEQPFETQMECFGNYDGNDEACQECNEAEQCSEATPGNEQPPDDQPDDQPLEGDEEQDADDSTPDEQSDELPNCYRQYEADDESCRDCDVVDQCAADSDVDDSNSQVEENDEPEPGGEEDPDVADLKAEAERLKNKNKSRGRGKGKK